MANGPNIKAFVDEPTATASYVVADPETAKAVIIDPVLDFDPASGRTGVDGANRILEFVREQQLSVERILETHAHADHLSAGAYLKEVLGVPVAIGAGIRDVQAHFAEVYNLDRSFLPDGSQFDHLFGDGERFTLGSLDVQVIFTPGHTPDHVSYWIGDAVFVGDSLFMADGGTARCDFPGGDAATLYRSIQRLFELPDDTRLFVLHDYRPGGREYRCETTVAAQRRDNIHVGGGRSEAEFVKLRSERDRTLDLPRLIIPAVQVNIRAGQLPPADANGVHYIRIPVNRGGDFSSSLQSANG